MRDVAERADVSITTVSHVINETRPVSEALKSRVNLAMNELGYQPNRLARSLRRGQTNTLGMIVPDNANPFFAEIARGVEDTGFGQGYNIILCNSDGALEKESLYTEVLMEKQVDGILFVAAGMSADHIRVLQKRGVPLVVVDREIPGLEVDAVLADHGRGGFLATSHLLALGHRYIGCIAGPDDVTSSAERVMGYSRALGQAGFPCDESLVLQGDYQYESGYRAARQFLEMRDPPTAIFACNDLMAVGAIRGAQECGYRIPAELSIVGYDDVSLASFTNPPLTTVAQPRHRMGVVAAEMLLERMADPTLPPCREILDVRLVVRQSSAPPRP
jgi:LacI family transcriptional regulator